VNLRSQRDSRHDDRVKEEAEFASKEGVTLFEIVLNPPTDENVKALLKVLDDERNYPVLVHCEHGKDRTGVAIAIFRMERMGWTSGQALMEMFEAGQGERLRYLDINESDRFVARYRPRFALHPSETPGVAPSPNRR
jgi:protein tyrosine phosphatase (PTP) superfamily phosphohydrolase (DUF442 family)